MPSPVKIPLPSKIPEHFFSLLDHRIKKKARHKLGDIIVITIGAAICGSDDWVYSSGGIAYFTTGINPTDAMFAILGLIGDSDEANDSMVGQCSSHLGDVIRDDYFQNHMDLTNLMFGLTSIFESSPQSIFRSHANRLKKAGL